MADVIVENRVRVVPAAETESRVGLHPVLKPMAVRGREPDPFVRREIPHFLDRKVLGLFKKRRPPVELARLSINLSSGAFLADLQLFLGTKLAHMDFRGSGA